VEDNLTTSAKLAPRYEFTNEVNRNRFQKFNRAGSRFLVNLSQSTKKI